MDIKEIRQQAQDENTSPKILAELAKSKDKEILRRIAGNPNTPVEILEMLGAELADAIVENPIFDLLLLENPESKFISLTFARASTTSVGKLRELANHKNKIIVEAVVKNQKTPVNILDSVFETNKHNLPFKIFLENKNTSDITLEKIAIYIERSNKNISSLILKHPNSSINVIKILEFHDGNLNTPYCILQKLAHHKDSQIRNLVAKYYNTPVDLLYKLSLDDCKWVKKSVAKHPKTTEEILCNLAKDNNYGVRSTVAERINISEEITTLLIKSRCWGDNSHRPEDCSWRIKKQLASHPKVSQSIINKLIEEEHHQIRAAIATREDISEEQAIILAHDISFYVLKHLASNPNIPIEVSRLFDICKKTNKSRFGTNTILDFNLIDKYYEKLSKIVISGVTENKIAERKSFLIKRRLASNQNLSIDTINKLKQDDNIICLGLTYNINTLIETLNKLTTNANHIVRQGVAEHSKVTVEILDKLKDDRNISVREKVAQSQNISIELIEYLAEDSVPLIRRAIAANNITPANILNKLKSDVFD